MIYNNAIISVISLMSLLFLLCSGARAPLPGTTTAKTDYVINYTDYIRLSLQKMGIHLISGYVTLSFAEIMRIIVWNN